MALFGRESDERPTPSVSTPPARATSSRSAQRKTTLIAAGAKLVGEISGDTDVMIEGTVEGKIHPKEDVSVGEQGVVRGEIQARRVRVAGKVEGNVRGRESVEILSTGSLQGDVSSPGMVIGDGAFFKGRVEMTGHHESKPAGADAPHSKSAKEGSGKEGKPEATPPTGSGGGAALSSSEAGA